MKFHKQLTINKRKKAIQIQTGIQLKIIQNLNIDNEPKPTESF